MAQDAEELEPVEQRQAEVEQDEIGRIARDGGEGRRAGADDVGADFAAAFERVLDEIGDIPFVLDDEHPLGPRSMSGPSPSGLLLRLPRRVTVLDRQ